MTANGRSSSGWVRGAVRVLWRPVLILAVSGALALWILGWDVGTHPTPAPSPAATATITSPPDRRWAPRETRTPTPGCAPEAERRCVQGDAWWFDSCGNPYARAEECEHRRCLDGACEAPDPPDCGDLPVIGRCEGDVARMCDAGRPVTIDCGDAEARCVMTEEGPVCRARTELDCDDPPGTATCEGPELVACIEGRRERFDCRRQGGWCGPLGAGTRVGCVVDRPVPGDACGACGCPLERGEEVCDGRDNDADGYIDEDDDCSEVEIVAFVVEDDRGNSSYSDEDLRHEVERINDAYARDDDYGLKFRLGDILALRRPEWLTLDDKELDEILATGAIHPARDGFYVPILFTDELLVEQVPRPGLSTGPNGYCGRMRRTPYPQSPIGLVAIAKRRWPSTVAHELGHYFGLCHTHGDTPNAVHRFEEGEGERTGPACEQPCASEADGICDTPVDPGPTECTVDATCAAVCSDGATPDTANIMGYYPSCRGDFTTEQALLMRETLYLRRSWDPCIWGDGCACDPLAPECPEQMTCRNLVADDGETKWRCGMAGASIPGAPCDSNLDCSEHSICISTPTTGGRCVRPCTAATPACDCDTVDSLQMSLCMADFAATE